MFSIRNNHAIKRFISKRNITDYVPKSSPVNEDDLKKLQTFLDMSKSLMVITGAGVSTESGIPDYRSEGVGLYARSNHKPMNIKDFFADNLSRKRYWTRNFIGFPRVHKTQPNQTHFTLKRWEDKNRLDYIVTQNVDGLHGKAGSKRVVELHGSGYLVKCTAKNCNYKISRMDFQDVLIKLNEHLLQELSSLTFEIRPDMDVDINSEIVKNFQIPHCPHCTGILIPNIVFFGDNVPIERVEFVYDRLQRCDSLLVLGSSLTTFSAFRFILKANELNKQIAIVNIGKTRADYLNLLRIQVRCGEILPLLDV